MPGYTPIGTGQRLPRRNEFLRSTVGIKTESWMLDPTLVSAEAPYLLRGTAMARNTTTGLVGPYDAAATDGRQTDVLGFLDTSLPALPETPTAVAVFYACTVVEAECIFFDAAQTGDDVWQYGVPAAVKTALSNSDYAIITYENTNI